MKNENKCPHDCYLYEKSAAPSEGDYISLCKLNLKDRKCSYYLKRLPGTRTDDPVLVYHALLGIRSKRITLTISILAVLISLASFVISSIKKEKSNPPVIYLIDNNDSLKITKFLNQNERVKNTNTANK